MTHALICEPLVCRFATPWPKGLWEARSSLPSKFEARKVFGFHDGALIALTAFIRRTPAASAGVLLLAQRLKEVTGS
jgi:hypothetical protein